MSKLLLFIEPAIGTRLFIFFFLFWAYSKSLLQEFYRRQRPCYQGHACGAERLPERQGYIQLAPEHGRGMHGLFCIAQVERCRWC